MKRKKYNRIKLVGIFCVTAVISIMGIFLPGRLLHSDENLNENNVANVPDIYYSASRTAMARNNSNRMKVSEKLQLISGQWESVIFEAKDYEMSLDNYEVVKIVKEELSKLNELGLYPSSFSEKYANWYSWETECFKAVDATFETYTAYYWVINLNKYDGTEKNIIYVLEDGTVFFAKGVYDEKLNILDMHNAYDVEEIGGERVNINFTAEQISDWVLYPNTDTDNMKWHSLSYATKDDEKYSIVQGYTENEYIYSYTPVLSE